MSTRERVLAGLLLVAVGVAWWRPWEGSPPAWVGAGLMTRQMIAPLKDEAPRVAAPARARPPDAPPNVIFVVLDTVRADHTSTCGYALPTTPRLQALVAGGASLACRAIAPADWTLPSHASFFTGRSPLEHGARFAAAEGAGDIEGVPLVPLGDTFATLAETFRARGYHTVMVAANPMLQAPTGLGARSA